MLMKLGLVRGLIGQLVGTLAGVATVTLFRVILGMPAWAAEPAWWSAASSEVSASCWAWGP